MDALTMQHMSAMPAPTWRWLRMNDTTIEIPQGLERVGGTEIEAEDALLDTTATFEGAVAELQERLDAARGGRGEKSGTADSRASVRAAKLAAEDIADLDTPALSRYQRRAALEEDAGDVAAAFETGVGADARAYLGFIAGGAIDARDGGRCRRPGDRPHHRRAGRCRSGKRRRRGCGRLDVRPRDLARRRW